MQFNVSTFVGVQHQTPKTLLNRSIGANEREYNTREIGMVGVPYEVKETNTPN